ncbi:hypothetical protein GGR55DRAFT_646127 [Xylaria sp. FL0064]|nr:hypothetical protein GGR55DRAFT_646127 [Xylaria sp. FL0064]
MAATPLPETHSDWSFNVQKLGLTGKSIHEAGSVSSGSRFGLGEFLLLRILWPEENKARQLYLMYQNTKPLEEVKVFLDGGVVKTIWSNYLQSTLKSKEHLAKEGYAGLGTFSLVRYHQLQSQHWKFGNGDTRSKVDFSPPISSRTRSQTSGIPTTPTRAPKGLDIEDPLAALTLDDAPASSHSTQHSTSSSGSLSTPPGQGDNYYPPGALSEAIEDEQIVNTALIEYLNALAIHHPQLEADWTLHRLPLVARNIRTGAKTYEARIDGYLRRRRDNAPLVILEVKPHRRLAKEAEIRMQEGAQMAAWISQYPPRNLEDMRQKNYRERRLLISQDRDDIYLTFAEFDASYVDYIRHRSNTTSFLTMNEYGPFSVGNKDSMKELGELVLVLALRACKEMSI